MIRLEVENYHMLFNKSSKISALSSRFFLKKFFLFFFKSFIQNETLILVIKITVYTN